MQGVRSHRSARTAAAAYSSSHWKCMTEAGLTSRPPLILLANEHEWAARSLETILGPHGYAVLQAYRGRHCPVSGFAERLNWLWANVRPPTCAASMFAAPFATIR